MGDNILHKWRCDQCNDTCPAVFVFEGGNGEVGGTASVCGKCLRAAVEAMERVESADKGPA